MEDRGGRIELLLPYATLEPIRELAAADVHGREIRP
jgi:flagellar motor switch protein FliM